MVQAVVWDGVVVFDVVGGGDNDVWCLVLMFGLHGFHGKVVKDRDGWMVFGAVGEGCSGGV